MKAPFHISDIFGPWLHKHLARRALDEIMRENAALKRYEADYKKCLKALNDLRSLRETEREYFVMALKRKRRALYLANLALKARKEAFGELPKDKRPEKTERAQRIARTWKYCRVGWHAREMKKRAVTVAVHVKAVAPLEPLPYD